MTTEREEKIRQRAHQIWEREGRPHGHHEQHWEQAREEIDREVEAPHGVYILRNGRQTLVQPYDPFDVDLEHMDEGGSVKAPMHGKLVAVFVQPGDRVEKGQRLAIVEAMKMEHVLVAPSDAEVAEIAAEPGAQVAEGARLIVLKTEE